MSNSTHMKWYAAILKEDKSAAAIQFRKVRLTGADLLAMSNMKAFGKNIFVAEHRKHQNKINE